VRSRTWLAAVGAVAAAAVLSLTVGAAHGWTAQAAPTPGKPLPGPFDDSFYLPPKAPPAGQPGDIVRWRPSVPLLNVANADAWEVMYLSTNALGKPNVVTGTVLVPKGVDTAKAPIVGYAVGTQGPAFKCAASKAISRGSLYDQPFINDSISAGFAVAVTDYEGYSPRTTPTYITGQSMGPAVIDAVRAAQRLPDARLSRTAKVIFQGYSQGGGGAMWAGERQPSYAPEINLVGVVAGGVPADLVSVARTLDGGIGFGFLAFAAVGLDAAYPELNLDSFLNATGRAELGKARKDFCTAELLLLEPFKRIADLTTTNPLDTPQWNARLAQNKLGTRPPRVPVFQYHARDDQILNLPQAEALRETYCAKGVQLQFDTVLGEHALGFFNGARAAHEWIVNRFKGAPPSPNCHR
jgi:pimeloyl-ACP methyl ester carboxylesterase